MKTTLQRPYWSLKLITAAALAYTHSGVLAADTVAEVWGDEAVPKNCFEVIPAVGSIENGQKASDWNQLQNTSIISFEHRITDFKRCFPFRSNELNSLALYLETPVD